MGIVPCRDHLAVVSVESSIAGAGRVVEAGMEGQAEEAALVIGVGRVQRRRTRLWMSSAGSGNNARPE